MYGGDHYEYVDAFQLEKDEKITSLKVNSGVMIDGLTFCTSKGRTLGPYGGSGGGAKTEKPPQEGVSGFLTGLRGIVVYNRDDLAIRKLGFKWAYYDIN